MKKAVTVLRDIARDILPHLLIALAVVVLSFFILDRFNRAMNFINNDHTKRLLAIFGQLLIVQAVLLAVAKKNTEGILTIVSYVLCALCGVLGEAFVIFSLTPVLGYEGIKWMLPAFCALTVALAVLYIIARKKEGGQSAVDNCSDDF